MGYSPWGHKESDTTERLHDFMTGHGMEKEMATYSCILAWRIPWTEEPGGYSPWDRKELDMTE